MLKYFFFLALVLCSFVVKAQDTQLFGKHKIYTRADTLRGSITPERAWFDVQYYDLNITLKPEQQWLGGYNDIYFKTTSAQNRMQLDLFANLQVDSIIFAQKLCKYTREYNAVFVTLPQNVNVDSSYVLRFYYSGKPTVAKMPPWDGGFVWKKDNNNQPFVGVACQGMGASVWFPNKDHQSDEPDKGARISCTVPNNLMAISNGQFVASEAAENNQQCYTWRVTYPINNYAISLYVGNYVPITDQFISPNDTLPITYYVLSYNKDKATAQFAQTKPMLQCFEQYLGKYPFANDGYKVVEAPYLGMEHQSAIAYGNGYKNGYMGMDLSKSGWGDDFDYILIHETGHEWWGNNISTADIADMWVHESFCTYTESLYVGCRFGEKAADEYINGYQKTVENDRPIIGKYNLNEEGSSDMYYKGALMLHTIRWVIDNDSLWFGILKQLNQDFRYQVVTGQQIEQYISQKAGIDLSSIFDQYLRQPNPPTLQYKVTGNAKKNKLTLSYRWQADVTDFNMPVWLKVLSTYQHLPVTTQWQSIEIPFTKDNSFKFDTNRGYFLVDKGTGSEK